MSLIYHFAGLRIWQNSTLPYEISASLPDQQRIIDAIQHWTDNTNVVFVERTSANSDQYPDYVVFREEPNPSRRCRTKVGRRGGRQSVWLAARCNVRSVIHEIGHALGMKHEQSRRDRNNYVEIIEGNIPPNFRHNFERVCSRSGGMFRPICLSYYNHTGDYDYESIMHYSRSAFARADSVSIRTIDPYWQNVIGTSTGLSHRDIAGINNVYSGPGALSVFPLQFVESDDPTEDPEWHKERDDS